MALPAGCWVFDAGCGEGSATLHLAERFGYRVSGIDPRPESIARVRRRAARRRPPAAVDLAVGSYASLDFPGRVFDCAFTLLTLVYAADRRVVLAELRQVLRPVGRLVLVQYSIAYPRSHRGLRPTMMSVPRETAKTRVHRHGFHQIEAERNGCVVRQQGPLENNGRGRQRWWCIATRRVTWAERTHEIIDGEEASIRGSSDSVST